MFTCSRSLVVLSVAAALTVPATLEAQTAIPRTGGSSSSSGSSGGSSSGGDTGSTTSSSGGGTSRVSVPSIPSSPTTDNRRPSSSASSRSEGSSSSSRSGAVDRGDGPVGPGTSRGTAVERGSSMVPTSGGSSSYLGTRPRGDRPVTGTAMERPFGLGGPDYNLYFPFDPFSPWGRWYPWYYGGYGYGYVSFDPWRYGVSRYSMFRYGAWYSPYDPWCFGVGYWLCDPWGGATTTSYGSGGGTSTRSEREEAPTASIRLRVSPSTAKVYVDGALVGTVSDFSGLSGHLRVTLGQHLIEIKEEGYETFVPKVELSPGRTTTVRGSLKKLQ